MTQNAPSSEGGVKDELYPDVSQDSPKVNPSVVAGAVLLVLLAVVSAGGYFIIKGQASNDPMPPQPKRPELQRTSVQNEPEPAVANLSSNTADVIAQFPVLGNKPEPVAIPSSEAPAEAELPVPLTQQMESISLELQSLKSSMENSDKVQAEALNAILNALKELKQAQPNQELTVIADRLDDVGSTMKAQLSGVEAALIAIKGDIQFKSEEFPLVVVGRVVWGKTLLLSVANKATPGQVYDLRIGDKAGAWTFIAFEGDQAYFENGVNKYNVRVP